MARLQGIISMHHPILEFDDSIGFCTLLETTKSSLFVKGCSILADQPDGCDFWFDACVPQAASAELATLRQLIADCSPKAHPWLSDSTPILIQVRRNDDLLLSWGSEKQAKLASTLVNRFLRAYEHTYLDVRVPRHHLDGRPIVLITPECQISLHYTPVLLDLDDALLEYLPSHTDIEQDHLSLLMGRPGLISPSWRILVDGVRHFENGSFPEAVLCACSAAEIVASPAIDRWLGKQTLNGGGDGLRNVVREMGNPLRFDLCLSTACAKAFADLTPAERQNLLAELSNMNNLRNRVVHSGVEPEPPAAAAALRASATFVCKIWLAFEWAADDA